MSNGLIRLAAVLCSWLVGSVLDAAFLTSVYLAAVRRHPEEPVIYFKSERS